MSHQVASAYAMHLGRSETPVAVPGPGSSRVDQRGPAQDGRIRRTPERKPNLDRVAILLERTCLEVGGGERSGE